MELNKLGMLVVLFMGVIVVLAMLPQIATNTKELTSKIQVVNETIDFGTYPLSRNVNGVNITWQWNLTYENTGWNIANCPLSGLIVLNQSNATLTSGTDFVIDLNYGNFSFKQTNATNTSVLNTTSWTYTYCPAGYAGSSGARAVANLILICAALGLMAFAAWGFYKGWFGNQ